MRSVKGELFADYVRMVRGHKGVDWRQHLPPEDMQFLTTSIIPGEWYPMATFERLGNVILEHIAHGSLEAVRVWGRHSVEQLGRAHTSLIAASDPMETLNRFRVLRSTFFDFEALELALLHEDEARVVIRYHMGMPAEEAAAVQTQGFFERLLELSGADGVKARFVERSWAGDPRTLLELRWNTGR